MALILPSVDYSPLKQAVSFETQAKVASVTPRQMQLQSKEFALEQRKLDLGVFEAVADTALKVGQLVYNIYNQGKLEEGKERVFNFQQEAQQKIRDMVATNQVQYNADGTVRLPDEFATWFNEQTAGIDEQFKFAPEVQAWAKGAMRETYGSLVNSTLGEAAQQKAQERNAKFLKNLDRTVAADVASNDPEMKLTKAQIDSASWLTSDAKASLLEEASHKVKVGQFQATVRMAAQRYGYDGALSFIDNRAPSGDFSQEELDAFRGVAAAGASAAAHSYDQQITQVATDAVARGITPKDAVDEWVNANVPSFDQTRVRKTGYDAAETARNLQGTKMWEEYVSLTTKGAMTEYDYRRIAAGVDEAHQGYILAALDNYLAAQAKDEAAQLAREQSAYTISRSAQIWEWSRTADPGAQGQGAASVAPWTDQDIAQWVASGVVSKEEGASLLEDYKKAALSPQDKNTAGIRADLYTALDSIATWKKGDDIPSDPRISVPASTINNAYASGQITEAQQKELLALRESLGAKFDEILKQKGPDVTDPKVEIDAARIVYSNTLTVTDKRSQLAPFLGNGLSGNDYSKWIERIEKYNADPNRKSILDTLTQAFTISMQNPNINTETKKELAGEMYSATQAMERYFVAHPDGIGWRDEMLKFLDQKQLNEISRLAQGSKLTTNFAAGTGIPSLFRGKYNEAANLYIANQQGKLVDDQVANRQYEAKLPEVKQLIFDVAKNVGLTTDPKDLNFYTVPSGALENQLVFTLKQPYTVDPTTGTPVVDVYHMYFEDDGKGTSIPKIERFNGAPPAGRGGRPPGYQTWTLYGSWKG